MSLRAGASPAGKSGGDEATPVAAGEKSAITPYSPAVGSAVLQSEAGSAAKIPHAPGVTASAFPLGEQIGGISTGFASVTSSQDSAGKGGTSSGAFPDSSSGCAGTESISASSSVGVGAGGTSSSSSSSGVSSTALSNSHSLTVVRAGAGGGTAGKQDLIYPLLSDPGGLDGGLLNGRDHGSSLAATSPADHVDSAGGLHEAQEEDLNVSPSLVRKVLSSERHEAEADAAAAEFDYRERDGVTVAARSMTSTGGTTATGGPDAKAVAIQAADGGRDAAAGSTESEERDGRRGPASSPGSPGSPERGLPDVEQSRGGAQDGSSSSSQAPQQPRHRKSATITASFGSSSTSSSSSSGRGGDPQRGRERGGGGGAPRERGGGGGGETGTSSSHRYRSSSSKKLQPPAPNVMGTRRRSTGPLAGNVTGGGQGAASSVGGYNNAEDTGGGPGSMNRGHRGESPHTAPSDAELKVFAFVNPKSGGKLGPSIYAALRRELCYPKGMDDHGPGCDLDLPDDHTVLDGGTGSAEEGGVRIKTRPFVLSIIG